MFYLIEIAVMYYGYYFIFMSLLTFGVFLVLLIPDVLNSDSCQDYLDVDEVIIDDTITVINFCEYKRRKQDVV